MFGFEFISAGKSSNDANKSLKNENVLADMEKSKSFAVILINIDVGVYDLVGWLCCLSSREKLLKR